MWAPSLAPGPVTSLATPSTCMPTRRPEMLLRNRTTMQSPTAARSTRGVASRGSALICAAFGCASLLESAYISPSGMWSPQPFMGRSTCIATTS